jgi:hypothetical protein
MSFEFEKINERLSDELVSSKKHLEYAEKMETIRSMQA